MSFRPLLTTLSGLAMATAPIAASANPSASLSVGAATRASAPAGESNLAGAPVLPLVLLAAIIAGGIYIAVDDDDGPNSP